MPRSTSLREKNADCVQKVRSDAKTSSQPAPIQAECTQVIMGIGDKASIINACCIVSKLVLKVSTSEDTIWLSEGTVYEKVNECT